jgi:hypothetical protein
VNFISTLERVLTALHGMLFGMAAHSFDRGSCKKGKEGAGVAAKLRAIRRYYASPERECLNGFSRLIAV